MSDPAAASELVRMEAQPAFDRLHQRGYEPVEVASGYPRVSVTKNAAWHLSIDFWMALTAEGVYCDEFSRKSGFDLGGAAALDRYEGLDYVRYWKPLVFYTSRPYDAAIVTLVADVMEVATVIEGWSEGAILQTATRIVLRT